MPNKATVSTLRSAEPPLPSRGVLEQRIAAIHDRISLARGVLQLVMPYFDDLDVDDHQLSEPASYGIRAALQELLALQEQADIVAILAPEAEQAVAS
jgi:hypothetical protein